MAQSSQPETKQAIEIFKPEPLDELKDSKVSFVDLFENNLITISENYIATYNINSNGKLTKDKHILGCKSSISGMICDNDAKIVFILNNNGSIYFFSLLDMSSIGEYKQKDQQIMMFAKNLDPKRPSEIVVVTKKKKLVFFKYNHEVKRLLPILQEISLEAMPTILKWSGDSICYLCNEKENLRFVNIANGQVNQQDFDVGAFAFVKDSWLLQMGEVGIFMTDGLPKSIDSLTLPADEVIDIKTFKNFIISLHKSFITVYDSSNSKTLQSIAIPVTSGYKGAFLINSMNRLIYIIQSDKGYRAWELIDLPVDEQIHKFLDKHQVDEALTVLNNNYASLDDTKPGHIEQFYLDCAWTYIKKHDYATAAGFLKMTNFNPCDFIYMFISLLKIYPIHDEFIAAPTDDAAKQRINSIQIETLTKDNTDKRKLALEMLRDILIAKRNYLMKNYEIPKDNYIKLSFPKSKLSLIDFPVSKKEIQISALFQLITLTLVKTLVKLNDSLKIIGEIIDNDPCENIDYFSDKFFETEKTDESRATIAFIYEKRFEYEKALNIWRDFGVNKENTTPGKEARYRTIKILTSFKDNKNKSNFANLFQEYIQWLLQKRADTEVFKVILSTDFYSVDYILSNIIPKVEEVTKTKELREKFLEYLNNTKPDEKYQTMLLYYYIEVLFEMKNKRSDTKLSRIEQQIYDKLKKLLNIEKACYNCDNLLLAVKDTWMKEIELFLLTRKGSFTEALKKLISIGKEKNTFQELENYCKLNISKQSTLYEEVYKLLAQEYNNEVAKHQLKVEALTPISTNEEDQPGYIYKKEMLQILTKYNECLDPIVIIDNTPDDWDIDNSDFFDYLTQSLKDTNHLSNKYEIAKNAVDIDLLYKRNEAFEEKKKSITITNETYCDFCRKKIGNSIFCVYPNMKIYHSKCAVNPSLDPTTRIDFSKKIW